MNDQIFQVGDKVMKVCGHNVPGRKVSIEVPWGVVLCVEDTKILEHGGQGIHLVGFQNTMNRRGQIRWFRSYCFRKVEEIRLCVEAVQHIKDPVQPEKVEA
jgi:hypothetical protein